MSLFERVRGHFAAACAARLVSAIVLAIACSHVATAELLESPGGKLQWNLTTSPQLSATVTAGDTPVVEIAAIGIGIDGVNLGDQPKVISVSKPKEVRESYRCWGAHATADNHYNEYVVDLQSQSGQSWTMEIRLFDDAVAYRLRVALEGKHRIDGDFANWQVPADATIWQQTAHNRSYEGEYLGSKVSELEPGCPIMLPATLVLPGNAGYAMLTEASLVNYSDRILEVTSEGTFRQYCHNDNEGWDQEGEVVTPWRAVVVTADLNQLVNSDAVANLCPPASKTLQDAAWIEPGRCSWHWLSTFHPRLEDQKEWIDGTSQLGWEYYLIDDGWRDWNGGGDAAWDAIADLVKYAAEKDVRLWAWVDSKYVFTHEQREEYFQRAHRIGLVGLKIDFPHAANVEWVNWYEDTLEDAAKAHLMIDFHGPVKPTGRQRTWPNELTREAIRGREQGKLPASHDTALPFVRFVQGPADYTPTMLTADKLNGSTMTHELAMSVVFTSPLLCMGDRPQHYLDSPAADLLKGLPCTWDETIVLPGSEVGSVAAFARRKGDDWFIGVINAAEGDFVINTDFLGNRAYQLVEFLDVAGKNDQLDRKESLINGGDSLSLRLSKDGGYVAWLRVAK